MIAMATANNTTTATDSQNSERGTVDPCEGLVGRKRDICRGEDANGRPLAMRPSVRAAYLDRWGVSGGNAQHTPEVHAEKSAHRVIDDRRATCRHLGQQISVAVCKTCGRSGAPAPVFTCGLHGECTLRNYGKAGVSRCCLTCTDFAPAERTAITWAVGITTAPRTVPTLERTLATVRAAGWPPVVYSEPESPVPDDVPTVRRPTKLGAWNNWLQTARQLLASDTSHVLIVQDDVEIAPDARAVVEAADWPADVGAVSLYTSAKYDRRRDGQHDIPTANFWGACALAFEAGTLRRLLLTKNVKEWSGDRNIDTAIGRACAELGLRIVGWSPSLGQHVGDTSTLGSKPNEGNRVAARVRSTTALPSAAVVILCANYGRFLAEAVASVLAQTVRPKEVVIVDDASDDDTPAVAMSFAGRGVRYLRIDARNTHAGRAAGFAATTADVVCFLDADDALPTDYLAAGLPAFADPRVAIVGGDMDQFGERTGRITLPAPGDHIDRENFLHAGSLVRRNALVSCRAFDTPIPCDSSNDWFLWRRILGDGWTWAKSRAVYRYRRHGLSQSHRRRGISYFELANLSLEPITLFLPLAGRWRWWMRLRQWVESQTWPHNQTRLVIADTSQHSGFHGMLRTWIGGLRCADVRLYRQDVGLPGLADGNRRDKTVAAKVNEAMPRIYNRMLREATTEYVAIVEDDLLPPLDAIDRLMRSFDKTTAAVSGAYRSRFADGFVAWDRQFRAVSPAKAGVVDVHGSGFGCVVIRRSVFSDHVFHHGARGAYDYNAADWLAGTPHRWRLDWSVRCAHGEFEPCD